MDIMHFLTETDFGRCVFTTLVSMIPIIELRGGIPFGVALGLPYQEAFVSAVIGNIIPAPFIIVYIRKIFMMMRWYMPRLNGVVDKMEKKAHLKGQKVSKYKYIGLWLFVAIPLPGTGAWTGSLAAAFLDMRLRKDMQNELKKIQQAIGITFIFVTHDQEEALSMSDTVVVMDKGEIQQIGSPIDIYNEPKNAFVADFIGESNILDGTMIEDYLVEVAGQRFKSLDSGFGKMAPVDVVIRPEDIDIVPTGSAAAHINGVVTSVTFKGVHYEIIVDVDGFKWMIQTTDSANVGDKIGLALTPDDIHVMAKSVYSGTMGDYSTFSDEMEEALQEEGSEHED